MSTYRQLIYLVSDLVKELTDDSQINEEHIEFLLNRYRTYLLKQKYLKKAQEIPISNYQTVCSNLKTVPTFPGCSSEDCIKDTNTYLRSEKQIEYPLTFSETTATVVKCDTLYTIKATYLYAYEDAYNHLNELFGPLPEISELPQEFSLEDYYKTACIEDVTDIVNILGEKYMDPDSVEVITVDSDCDDLNVAMARGFNNVNVVSRERFPYTGMNKYLKRSVYGTIEPDRYFYIKGQSEKLKEYTKVFITAIFEDPIKAYEQSACNPPCDKPVGSGKQCDEWDYEFPLEDGLQTQLLALVVKDVLGAAYRPSDKANNSSDDLASIEQFIRSYMKRPWTRQTEDNE